MGEEGKKENGGGHGVKEGKEKEKEKEKNEDKQDNKHNNDEIIVIKVDMHCQCQACAKKIAKSLRASPGVEDVAVDSKTNTVVVKGKSAEPMKLCDRIRHKTGRSAHLLSPLPKQPQPPPPPKDDGNKHQLQNVDKPPPVVVTVVLGVHMHCEACAQLLRKRIRKMKGVESVETDAGKGEVKVKGVIGDPEILVKYVHKKTRKQVSLLSVTKKDDTTSNQEPGKGKGQPHDNATSGHKNKADNEDDKKGILQQQQDNVGDNTTTTSFNNNNNDQDDAKMMRMRRMMMMGDVNRFHNINYNNWPSQLESQQSPSSRYDYMEYPHPHPQPHHHYDNNYGYDNNNPNNYQPHMFSDENPDACSIM